MNRRQRGDLGEYSAIEWLSSRGHPVFVPIGHSPDVELVALGGWTPVVHPVVGSRGGDGYRAGGPKYIAYEVELGRPFVTLTAALAG